MAQTNKRDNRVIAVVLLVAAALVAVGGISGYAAKYAHQKTDERDLSSPAFYFTSDVLTEDGSKTYDLPVGTTSISFELRNYADDLRYSDTEIDYGYTVTKDSDGSTVKRVTDQKIANNDTSPVANKVSVDVTGLSADTYTVTATSTKPFSQTLSAKFTIAAANEELNVSLADNNNSPTATLTVSTQDYGGNVVVSWPAGVVPDQTQTEFKDVATSYSGGSYQAGNVTITAEKFSTYTFRFFKTNPAQKYTTEITAAKASQ